MLIESQTRVWLSINIYTHSIIILSQNQFFRTREHNTRAHNEKYSKIYKIFQKLFVSCDPIGKLYLITKYKIL